MEEINTFMEAVNEVGDDVDPFEMLEWLSRKGYLNIPYEDASEIMNLLLDDDYETVEEKYPDIEVDGDFIWDTVDSFVDGNPYPEMVEYFKK